MQVEIIEVMLGGQCILQVEIVVFFYFFYEKGWCIGFELKILVFFFILEKIKNREGVIYFFCVVLGIIIILMMDFFFIYGF